MFLWTSFKYNSSNKRQENTITFFFIVSSLFLFINTTIIFVRIYSQGCCKTVIFLFFCKTFCNLHSTRIYIIILLSVSLFPSVHVYSYILYLYRTHMPVFSSFKVSRRYIVLYYNTHASYPVSDVKAFARAPSSSDAVKSVFPCKFDVAACGIWPQLCDAIRVCDETIRYSTPYRYVHIIWVWVSVWKTSHLCAPV